MSKKVLVVEDSKLLQSMYRLILDRHKDCEVIAAYDGKEGIERFKANPDTSLVILDINMPGVSGFDFLRHLRGNLRSAVPAIIVTTEGRDGDIKRGLALGANAYLIKPFVADTLHELIDRFIA